MNGDEDKEYKDNEEEDEFGEFTGADDDNNIEKEKHETCTSDVEVIEQNTRGCVQPLSRSSVDVPVLDHLVGKSYAERVRWVREDLKNRRGGMRGDDCGDDLGRSCVYDMKELEERYGEVLKVGSVEGLTRPGWHGSACEGRLRERLVCCCFLVVACVCITRR